jgi:hypothetical protein
MAAAAPNVIITSSFKLADRIKIQQETIRNKNYIIIGRLTGVLWEGQRSTTGWSQSRPRWNNPRQAKELKEQPGLHPMSEKAALLWASITLDWLTHKDAPLIAVSRDQQDLLLPFGLTPLPKIPDPRWVPTHAQHACRKSTKTGCKRCVAPRIPQILVGCPVVGDRVRDKITARDGHVFGVIQPVVELAIMLGGAQGGFGRIKGTLNPSDGTRLSLLIDDSDPEHLEAYWVGGRFQLGG